MAHCWGHYGEADALPKAGGTVGGWGHSGMLAGTMLTEDP